MLVISHFSSKVVNVKAGDGAAMMEIIEKEAIVLPTDRLAKFPELRFRYGQSLLTFQPTYSSIVSHLRRISLFLSAA